MQFRRAFVVTVFVQTVSFAASALYVLLISRWLGSAGKGLQSVLVSSAQILAMVLGLGFHLSVTFFVAAQPRRTPAVLQNQARLLVGVTFILAVAALLNRRFGFYSPLFSYELLTGTFVIALIAQSAFTGALLGLNHTWSYNISSALPVSFAVVAISVQRLLGVPFDVTDAVSAQVVGTFLGALYGLVVLRADARSAPGADAIPLSAIDQMRVGMKGFLSHVFTQTMFRGDVILIASILRDLRAAGVYSIAVFIVESSLRVPQWAAALLSPRIAANDSKPERTIRLFWASIFIVIVELLPLLLLRSVVEKLLTTVLGRDFSGAYVVLLAVLPRAVVHSGVSILAGDLAGRGYTWYHPLANFVGMCGVLGLDLILVPRFGLIGAGIASSIGATLMMLVFLRGFLRHANLSLGEFWIHSVNALSGLRHLRKGRHASADT